MKRNMLAIVILAATLVNIALTALMLFTVIPKAQRTDALIQKICSIIDLELEDPDAADYVEIPFEELIFSDGECIGIYHEECVLLFGDPKTHRTPKWLGEFVTGPDSSVDVYDYYLLIQNEL